MENSENSVSNSDLKNQLDRIEGRLISVEKKVDKLNGLMREALSALADIKGGMEAEFAKTRRKINKGYILVDRRLKNLDKEVKDIKSAVNQVVKYLEESNVEISATASDFEGLLRELGAPESHKNQENPVFERLDFDEIMPVEEFLAANVFRLVDSEGVGLKNKKLGALLGRVKNSGNFDVDKACTLIKKMNPEDLNSLKKYRDMSLSEAINRATLQLKEEVHSAVYSGQKERPLKASELRKCYQEVIKSLNYQKWYDKTDLRGGRGRCHKIAEQALINLYENKVHFMAYNQKEFEARVKEISSAIELDQELIQESHKGEGRLGAMKKSFVDFGKALSNGGQDKLTFDPNSMSSLFTAKNIAYGIRSYTTFAVHSRASKMFGKELADEVRNIASEMNTRQGMMNKLADYLIEETKKGSPGAPSQSLLEEMDDFRSKIVAQWDSNSFEGRFIVKNAFKIALAKVNPDSFRHLAPKNGSDSSEKDIAVAEHIISAACVLGDLDAQKYLKGRLDEQRDDIRMSYMHEMEQSGDLMKVIKQIQPELRRNLGSSGLQMH